MLILDPILRGVVLPAGVTLVVLVWGRRRGRLAPEPDGAWVVPVAMGAGFATGFVALFGWPSGEHWHRLLYVAPGAALVGALLTKRRVPVWAAVLVSSAATVAMSWFLAPQWDDMAATRWAWRIGASALIGSAWLAIASAFRRDRPTGGLIAMLIVFAAAAGLTHLSHNGKLTQICGAAAATIGALLVIEGFRPAQLPWRGAAPLLATILVGVVFCGKFYDYGNVPEASFVLVASAPVWLNIAAGWRRRTWLAVAAEALLVVMPLAFAFALAIGDGGEAGEAYSPY